MFASEYQKMIVAVKKVDADVNKKIKSKRLYGR